MNRYIADGVLADMRRGRRVMVISSTLQDADRVFLFVQSRGLDEGEHVYRTHGEQRIVADKGEVRFTSINASVRGPEVDVFYVDTPISPGQHATLTLNVKSRGGEVILP